MEGVRKLYLQKGVHVEFKDFFGGEKVWMPKIWSMPFFCFKVGCRKFGDDNFPKGVHVEFIELFGREKVWMPNIGSMPFFFKLDAERLETIIFLKVCMWNS